MSVPSDTILFEAVSTPPAGLSARGMRWLCALAAVAAADPDVQAEAWLTWLHGAEERLGRRLTRSELAAVRDQVRALRAAAPSTDEAVA